MKQKLISIVLAGAFALVGTGCADSKPQKKYLINNVELPGTIENITAKFPDAHVGFWNGVYPSSPARIDTPIVPDNCSVVHEDEMKKIGLNPKNHSEFFEREFFYKQEKR